MHRPIDPHRETTIVRGAVLLIVVPAFFIVPVYFLTVVKEIVVDKRFSPGIYYEERFAAK